MKKEKEICVRFDVAPQTAKVMARVCDKCLIKMEKALSFGVEDMTENLFLLTATCCARKH